MCVIPWCISPCLDNETETWMIGLYYYVDCNQCTTRMDQKISMEIPIFPRVLLITGVLTFLVAPPDSSWSNIPYYRDGVYREIRLCDGNDG